MHDLDRDKQTLRILKIETDPKQKNFRLCECDTRVSTNICDVIWGAGWQTFLLTKFFVWNTRYNAFVIVIPGFSESESDIVNDIPSISSDILGILNWKNWYTRFIENMWQLAFIQISQTRNSFSIFYFEKHDTPIWTPNYVYESSSK